MIKKWPLCVVSLFLLTLAIPVRAIKIEKFYGPLGHGRAIEVAAGQVMVKFSSTHTPAQRTATVEQIGARVISELDFVGWTVVGLPAGMSVSYGLNALQGLPGILDIEPNHVYRAGRVPNDPLLSSQYALIQVDAFRAWEYEVGISCRVTIAVLDTGIDGTHPDLSGKLVGTSQFFNPDDANPPPLPDSPTPACNHATRVAGVAAAGTDNGLGIAGMSWGANLISLKVFKNEYCDTDCGNFDCVSTDPAMISAIEYATTLHNSTTTGKIVLNISLGNEINPICPGAVQEAISSAVIAGVMIVAAAGNDGGPVNSPANCNGVIPVGATGPGNNIAGFSSRGPELAARGVVAPGVGVLTTDLGGNTALASGTSFATPMVAGLAALIWSAKPGSTAEEVGNFIRQSADEGGNPGPDTVYGWGRINAFRALSLGIKGTITEYTVDKKDEPVAYPNPFRVSTHKYLFFKVPKSIQGSDFEIKIYTMAGEKVRTLNAMLWNGKNDSGSPVASGVYIFRAKSSNGSGTGRFALIR